MINYQEILNINNYNKSYSCSNVFDWNSFIFDISSEKPTNEQIEIMIKNVSFILCKETAKQKISLSDWSVLPDVKIENKSEFENYRSTLRNYILNPVENPIFPPEPEPIWITN